MNEKTETTAEISIGKWLNQGWEMITTDLGNFVLLTLIYLVLLIALSFTMIGELLISGPLTVGYFLIVFNKLKGKPFNINDITSGFNVKMFIASLLASILVGVFLTVGFILLIIPGIVVWALYMFTFPYIAEKELDFWAAMEASRKLVSKHLFEFSVFALVQIIICFIGLLVFGVGLLVAIPLVYASIGFAFKDMVGLE